MSVKLQYLSGLMTRRATFYGFDRILPVEHWSRDLNTIKLNVNVSIYISKEWLNVNGVCVVLEISDNH